ncbi:MULTISPECIES: phage tail domain-containing protein [Ruminococcus]|uniref:phage distal tail protein n=1 Tax=Ruminococcus TaxID=1263 RepID=UPI000E4450A5|nr:MULTISPECIES: phage tail domain-containing protein [Ruminococcus]RGM78001.1 phage tail family protein [Ruminococcus sp. OM06-36AC]DAK95112.1 MAG TPA: tail protein [Caudoviricetes sp.]
MFFTMILENQSGDRIDMTTTANQYMTSKIDGLNPPAGTVSTSTYAGMDGSYLNNDFIEKQNVVIPFEMRGFDVELRRHELYRVVKPSRYIKIYYSTKNISVYAEGIVETCEVENFEKLTNGQISILCPDIYWYSTETQIAEYSRVRGAFHFICPDNDEPFPIGTYNTQDMMTINNNGDEVGFTLEISGGPAKNPTIYNALTDEYMQISGDIQKGDSITITTKTGNKTVTLEREGIVTNIINRLVSGSTWLNLKTGENKFYVTASEGLNRIKVRLIHRNAYLGV